MCGEHNQDSKPSMLNGFWKGGVEGHAYLENPKNAVLQGYSQKAECPTAQRGTIVLQVKRQVGSPFSSIVAKHGKQHLSSFASPTGLVMTIYAQLERVEQSSDASGRGSFIPSEKAATSLKKPSTGTPRALGGQDDRKTPDGNDL